MPIQRLFTNLILTSLLLVQVFLVVSLAMFLNASANAEISLTTSRVWQRARMISSGQQVWSFQTSYQDYDQRFGQDGILQPLGQQYGRALTWRQLLNANPGGRAEMQDFMKQNSVSETNVAATANYQVHREETGMAANWAYGLTSRWMIGFQLPLTYRRTNVTPKVELTPTLALGAGRLLHLNSHDTRRKVIAMVNDQLHSDGYDSVPEQKNSWDLGDISLLSQVQLAESYAWTWSIQQLVRLPSAQNPSVSDYLQTNTDDGQVDLGLTSLVDYRWHRVTAGWRVGYVAQLPDSMRMHVPASADGESSSEVDPSLHRDLGDYGWTAVDVENRFTRNFSADVGYSYLKKAPDRYSGQSVSGVDYSGLGQDSSQELHQTRAGIQYRLGEASSRRGVENKWVASLDYSYPWIGRNSSEASRTSVELISYF